MSDVNNADELFLFFSSCNGRPSVYSGGPVLGEASIIDPYISPILPLPVISTGKKGVKSVKC